jgi:hypothetical protein
LGRRSPSGPSSTNGSRTQASTFSLAISLESAKVAIPSGRISSGRTGSSPLSREAASSAPSSDAQPALSAA